jgi:hypothetical protein
VARLLATGRAMRERPANSGIFGVVLMAVEVGIDRSCVAGGAGLGALLNFFA